MEKNLPIMPAGIEVPPAFYPNHFIQEKLYKYIAPAEVLMR